MSTTATTIDFSKIRTDNGSQSSAFEEFCCQLARRDSKVAEQEGAATFQRLRGAGGDGGVECLWTFIPEDGETVKWGWQSKFFWELDKSQMDKSVGAAVLNHPELTRYVFCLPFDPTGKRQGPGKSEVEKLEGYVKDWEAIAAENGAEVKFEIWFRSDLIDRLTQADPHGGLRRYWFDEPFFAAKSFEQHVMAASVSAQPRYTPYLRVTVPIYHSFSAFGQSSEWFSAIRKVSRDIIRSIRYWAVPAKSAEKIDYPADARDAVVHLRSGIDQILHQLSDIEFERIIDKANVGRFLVLANQTLQKAEECLSLCIKEVEQKHGQGTAKSALFKQFMADYNAELPTRHVDRTEQIVDALRKCVAWAETELELASTQCLLVLGRAGSGKTHAFCDLAIERLKSGAYSICLFGNQFGGATIWETFRSRLGLSAALGRDELLSALNAAAEASGNQLIIFIDALNETEQRDYWKNDLPEFIEQLKPYPFLKLSISCRTSYKEYTLPEKLDAAIIYHEGFTGVELDACNAFFDYYKLGSPQIPLLQPEFSNPLFLRLTCETLAAEGQHSFPDNIVGMGDLVDRFVKHKNEKISDQLNIDRKEKVVQLAIENLVQELINTQSLSLDWLHAKELVDSVRKGDTIDKSLFHCLIKEELLYEDSVVLPNGDSVDKVWFGFQRLSDHLIAKHCLEEYESVQDFETALAEDSWIRRLFDDLADTNFSTGIIEALFAEVPRCFGRELIQLLPAEFFHDQKLWEICVASLPWRQPETIGEEIVALLQDRFTGRWFTPVIFRVLFSLSPISSHPLGAAWLQEQLLSIPIEYRDGMLCTKFINSWENHGVVEKLIEWAFGADLAGLSGENILAWSITLSWFLSSADRRIRDHSTKALVRLLSSHPSVCKPLIEQFLGVDDDYVFERVLGACYGALLRTRNENALKETAELLLSTFFKDSNRQPHAQIRDYARLIVQLADERTLLHGVSKQSYCPPYKSAWPLKFPDENWIAEHKESSTKLPGLYQSLLGFPADFGRYTMGSALSEFRSFANRQSAAWIMKSVLDMGYPGPGCLQYDVINLSRFGGGRGRPVWAERIGKKYQWISLNRLLAHIADHEEPTLQLESRDKTIWLPAERLRDLDLSTLSKEELIAGKAWWFAGYDEAALNEGDDLTWLASTRMPVNGGPLVADPNETEYVVLSLSHSWESTEQEDRNSNEPYRSLSTSFTSFLIPNDEIKPAWKYLKARYYIHGMLPDELEFYDTFLGEYPFAVPYREWFRLLEEDPREYTVKYDLKPAANTVSCHYEHDSYTAESLTVYVPSQIFFEEQDLLWDGVGSYCTADGKPVFIYPTLYHKGPRALLVDKGYLIEFLKKHNLSLLILELQQRYCSAQADRGPNDGTRFHMFSDGKLQSEPGACFSLSPIDEYPKRRPPTRVRQKKSR
ncbi:MAG: hypothetical protein HY986_11525 [Candidatus Melainabacteria bacterium]|nr:hypothetical protein [Candidatus Melainabacteria bacterium]